MPRGTAGTRDSRSPNSGTLCQNRPGAPRRGVPWDVGGGSGLAFRHSNSCFDFLGSSPLKSFGGPDQITVGVHAKRRFAGFPLAGRSDVRGQRVASGSRCRPLSPRAPHAHRMEQCRALRTVHPRQETGPPAPEDAAAGHPENAATGPESERADLFIRGLLGLSRYQRAQTRPNERRFRRSLACTTTVIWSVPVIGARASQSALELSSRRIRSALPLRWRQRR